MHRLQLGRAATLTAGLAIAVGSINLIGLTTASAATDPPTIQLNLPGQIGNGGDLQAGSATLANPADGAGVTGRVDFTISAPAGTNLTASELVVKYESAPSTFTTIPLTTNNDGTVSGYFGPAAGFTIPAGYNATTNLEVGTNPGAPSTTITTTAYIDTTPGDTSSSLGSGSAQSILSTPTISFTDYPATLPGGGSYAAYTGTLANTTGSNYGGSNPAVAPSPAGVRVDFSIASTKSINPSDLTLDYCLGGTTEACSGGTWQNIPLTAGTGTTLTGFYGPTGGFVLPNNASNTTPFRIKANTDAPATSLATTVSLDKVDNTGAATGTDSSGIDNGTIVSTSKTTAVQEPTLSFNLPSAIGNGGDLKAASVTIDNTGGAARTGVRVDLEVKPDSGTANLNPNDFIIEFDSGGTYTPVTLTADASGGGVHGFAPPSTGFPIDADHSDTTNLLVGTQPSAPVGSVTFSANLDTTPGDTTTSIASYTEDTKLTVPGIIFGTNYPKSISVGSPNPVNFTMALTNSTGSNYGGTSLTTAPTVAGLRPSLSIATSSTAVTGSDIVLQYCAGASDAACTGGTWTTIPLEGTGGTITGSFGPTSGFAVPNGAAIPIQLRAFVLKGTPTTTLTPTVNLLKVNASTGAATGADSTGVNNGLITSNTGAVIVAGPVRNPTIKATLKSAHAKTAAGWYRSPVTITFKCTAGSAALTTACPKTVVVSANTRGHVDTRTIKAADGGTASVTVTTKIDHTKPHASISGAKNGHTYSARRHLTAHCSDSLSGIKSCKVTSHRSGHTVKWTVRATDKAGNVKTHTGKYKIS